MFLFTNLLSSERLWNLTMFTRKTYSTSFQPTDNFHKYFPHVTVCESKQGLSVLKMKQKASINLPLWLCKLKWSSFIRISFICDYCEDNCQSLMLIFFDCSSANSDTSKSAPTSVPESVAGESIKRIKTSSGEELQ